MVLGGHGTPSVVAVRQTIYGAPRWRHVLNGGNDFRELRKHDVMRRALLAKFSQNEEHRAILLATGIAKLTHQPARSPVARVEVEVMEVRAELRCRQRRKL